MAEASMMELANSVVGQRAHDIVDEACKATIESSNTETNLYDELSARSDVTNALVNEKLTRTVASLKTIWELRVLWLMLCLA